MRKKNVRKMHPTKAYARHVDYFRWFVKWRWTGFPLRSMPRLQTKLTISFTVLHKWGNVLETDVLCSCYRCLIIEAYIVNEYHYMLLLLKVVDLKYRFKLATLLKNITEIFFLISEVLDLYSQSLFFEPAGYLIFKHVTDVYDTIYCWFEVVN